MKVTTLGIDLAKNIFRVHGVDARGKVVVSKSLSRRQVRGFMANLPPCLVGMESCPTSNYWAREIETFGHQVRLMAPRVVRPYVKANKNDTADAEAICQAVRRPSMRFVAVKSTAQQDVQAVHRVRAHLVRTRIALANQVRGLLAEYGARAALRINSRWHGAHGVWAEGLKARRGPNIAAVALASKNARVAWKLLSSGEHYRPLPLRPTQSEQNGTRAPRAPLGQQPGRRGALRVVADPKPAAFPPPFQSVRGRAEKPL